MTPSPTVQAEAVGCIRRWVIYQRERFPLLAHGPLVAVFSFSAVCFSSLVRGESAAPSARTALVAFCGSLCFFLQLRLADEFKDHEEDCRYRPYRAVPRGLVTLPQLARVWIGSGLLQVAMTMWLQPALITWLLVTWLYLALMSKEFFVGPWLRAHAFTYMWTHMLIMPLIDVYTSACDWLPHRWSPPQGLAWFLVASFFNGMVLEIGRKIRSPEEEEPGVQTYTVLWGQRGAVCAWLAALLLTAANALLAAHRVGFVLPTAGILGAGFLLAAAAGARFVRCPEPGCARFFQPISGLWTISLYLSLGVLPLLFRH